MPRPTRRRASARRRGPAPPAAAWRGGGARSRPALGSRVPRRSFGALSEGPSARPRTSSPGGAAQRTAQFGKVGRLTRHPRTIYVEVPKAARRPSRRRSRSTTATGARSRFPTDASFAVVRDPLQRAERGTVRSRLNTKEGPRAQPLQREQREVERFRHFVDVLTSKGDAIEAHAATPKWYRTVWRHTLSQRARLYPRRRLRASPRDADGRPRRAPGAAQPHAAPRQRRSRGRRKERREGAPTALRVAPSDAISAAYLRVDGAIAEDLRLDALSN